MTNKGLPVQTVRIIDCPQIHVIEVTMDRGYGAGPVLSASFGYDARVDLAGRRTSAIERARKHVAGLPLADHDVVMDLTE